MNLQLEYLMPNHNVIVILWRFSLTKNLIDGLYCDLTRLI